MFHSPTSQWFRDGTQIVDDRTNYSVNNKERTLTFKSASPDDNGIYYCCARNAVATVCSRNNFTLSIIGNCHLCSYKCLILRRSQVFLCWIWFMLAICWFKQVLPVLFGAILFSLVSVLLLLSPFLATRKAGVPTCTAQFFSFLNVLVNWLI